MTELHVVDGYDEVPDEVLFSGAPDDGDDWTEPTDEPTLPDSFDEAHAAESLATYLHPDWLYVAATNRWMHWNGTRWAADRTEQVYEVARRWAIDLVTVVARVGASSDDVKRAARYRDRYKLESVLTMARRIDGMAATPDEFDRHPDLLNVTNGVVDLRTGEVRPHDPLLRLSKLAPVDYRPDAYHADVGELLRVVDAAVLPWLKRLIGYAATGHTSEDVVAVYDGSGANGKTTLLEALGEVLGDYAGPVSPQLVMRTTHDQHPTIKADLQGQRLVWISETEEGGAFRMEQVKALTGGDKISARVMRGDFYTFTPTHTLVIATNHRPAVNSTEHAAWRRLRLVPFPFTYKAEHEAEPGDRVQDRGLRHRLTTGQAQRETLLAWVVAGAIEWNRDGLGTCPAIDTASRDWRRAEDVILRFSDECLDFGLGHSAKGRELYVTYCDWCAAEGRKAKSNKNFAAEFLDHEAVKAAEVERTTPQGSTVYRGVSVRGSAQF